MKNKNGLIAFALVGLAAGAAAWYLLGTEDGKKQLNRANDGIKDLTRSLKKVSKREAKRARKLANEVSNELIAVKDNTCKNLNSIKNKAKEFSQNAINSTNKTINDTADQIEETVDTVKNSLDKA